MPDERRETDQENEAPLTAWEGLTEKIANGTATPEEMAPLLAWLEQMLPSLSENPFFDNKDLNVALRNLAMMSQILAAMRARMKHQVVTKLAKPGGRLRLLPTDERTGEPTSLSEQRFAKDVAASDAFEISRVRELLKATHDSLSSALKRITGQRRGITLREHFRGFCENQGLQGEEDNPETWSLYDQATAIKVDQLPIRFCDQTSLRIAGFNNLADLAAQPTNKLAKVEGIGDISWRKLSGFARRSGIRLPDKKPWQAQAAKSKKPRV